MTQLNNIWETLKFVSEQDPLTQEQIEVLFPILQKEVKAREIKRIRYLLQRSGIKRIKRMDDFDWKFNPKIPREKIMAIYNSSWFEDVHNIVFIGPTGVGKSHMGDAFCYQAIQRGLPTARITCFDLVAKLKKSKNKDNLLQYYASIKVFCLDELGYVFPTQEQANDIFQIISKRSELLPTLVTTNLVPSKWGKIFEAATATAILDRLSLKGQFITCEGRSYRRNG
jgi:DNA replication protein DnaC